MSSGRFEVRTLNRNRVAATSLAQSEFKSPLFAGAMRGRGIQSQD